MPCNTTSKYFQSPLFYSNPFLYTYAHTHVQNGFFSLYFASQKGYDKIVRMLLQAGATVDLQTKVGTLNIHSTYTYMPTPTCLHTHTHTHTHTYTHILAESTQSKGHLFAVFTAQHIHCMLPSSYCPDSGCRNHIGVAHTVMNFWFNLPQFTLQHYTKIVA